MSLFRAPVNNASIDPFQGFDVEVWVTDLGTGRILDVGQFQSCTLTIRNATETYLPLGQRIPTYLDGEIQIAWVLERGKLSTDYLKAWFGTSEITKEQYLTRGPRFQISIDLNAVELKQDISNTTNYIINSRTNLTQNKSVRKDYFSSTENTDNLFNNDKNISSGRLEIVRCKLDSLSEGIMPGRRVIANRWEGVAEGIIFKNDSLQQFKDQRATTGNSFGNQQGLTNFGSNVI